jgi:hypothetical protein
MPAKTTKRKTSSSSSSSTTKRACVTVDITRAIERATRDHEALSKNIEKFVTAYNDSNRLVNETYTHTLLAADQHIEDRQSQLSALSDQIAYDTRQGKIKVDQDLAEYGMIEARKILQSVDMVAIHIEELDQLRVDLAQACENHDEEIKKAVAEAITREKIVHASVQSRTKSDAALELAQTKAQLESKNIIIESLNERVSRNEDDLAAARELTRQVADSAAQRATNVYTGNGK